MRGFSSIRCVVLCAVLAVAAAGVRAEDRVVSTMKNVNSVWQARGFYLTPVPEYSGEQGPRDLAPVQAFEIVRPRNERVTIGRLHTSCTCVVLEASQKTFEPGERAILRLHNVIATPPNGQMYAVYVQITRPIRTTLRFDTFVQTGSGMMVTESELLPPEDKKESEVPEVIVPEAEDAEVTKKEEADADADQPAASEGAEDTPEIKAADDADATAAQPEESADGHADDAADETEEKPADGGVIEIVDIPVPGDTVEEAAPIDDTGDEEGDIDPEMIGKDSETDVVEKIVLKAKEEAEEASAVAEEK